MFFSCTFENFQYDARSQSYNNLTYTIVIDMGFRDYYRRDFCDYIPDSTIQRALPTPHGIVKTTCDAIEAIWMLCAAENRYIDLQGREKDIISFPGAPFMYLAQYDRTIDGDTVLLNLDRGFGIQSKKKIRLAKINCPELKGDTYEKGLAAKEFTHEKLAQASKILVESHQLDLYGRAIATVTYDDIILNDMLVLKGLASYQKY